MVLAGGLVAGAMGVSLGLFNRLGSPAVRATLLLAFALVLIYVWGRAFLSNVALVVEDAGVFASLRISWGLIKHHWWRATTVYTVAIIIVLVFYVVIGVVDGIIGATLHNSLALAVVLGQVVAVLGGSVLMTFVPAVLISMYYDLKLRKEGADLAVRVNALTPQ
jgi:p-aminobenzoyl-glutamate transporter AbgT